MKTVTALLIGCCLAFAGAVMAQNPEAQESPTKKGGAAKTTESPSRATEKTKQPHGEAARKPTTYSNAPSTTTGETGATGASGATQGGAGKHGRRSTMGAGETGAKAETSPAAGTSPTTQTGAAGGKGKHGKAAAGATGTTAETGASVSPGAGQSPSAGGKKGGKAKGAAAQASASAAPSASASAPTSPTGAATGASPATSVPPATGAAGTTGGTGATAATGGAATMTKEQGTVGRGGKKVETQQVQQIKQQHASFKAQPRPDRAPAVQFNASFRIAGAERWQGPQYEVFRSYHPEWHDRGWYHSHYQRVELIAGGWYFWNNGYWYPAWGYDPGAAYYAYEGPIYVGHRAEPPDKVIADVQAELQEMGYYTGEVDGLLGPLTRQALRDYQADHGLMVTEAIDEPTLDALQLG